MSEYKKGLLKGTLILTAAGLISRIAGFFYKIFLSRAIGAEQIGIYQLAMPLYLLAFSVCVTGIQSALSGSLPPGSPDSSRKRLLIPFSPDCSCPFSCLLGPLFSCTASRNL